MGVQKYQIFDICCVGVMYSGSGGIRGGEGQGGHLPPPKLFPPPKKNVLATESD